MDRGAHIAQTTELGTVSVTSEAIAQIVGHVAAESYGIVGHGGSPLPASPRPRPADRRDRGKPRDGGVEIDLHVVVEYGLNLAEVAATVRRRVAYEVERQTGLAVAASTCGSRTCGHVLVIPRSAPRVARPRSPTLEANRQRIDDLNVYPVPDGDTGTNLTLTVRAIVDALEQSHAEGHEAVARELSRAALMGARGNSGVIFSQIVRGFADVLGEREPDRRGAWSPAPSAPRATPPTAPCGAPWRGRC